VVPFPFIVVSIARFRTEQVSDGLTDTCEHRRRGCHRRRHTSTYGNANSREHSVGLVEELHHAIQSPGNRLHLCSPALHFHEGETRLGEQRAYVLLVASQRGVNPGDSASHISDQWKNHEESDEGKRC